MPLYETTLIIRPDVTPNEVTRLTENYTNFINNNNGKVLKTESWGMRNLAYKIKKNRKANYVVLSFDLDYDNLNEIERQMKLNENILKNITIRQSEIDLEPSAIMNSKNSEEESNSDNKENIQEFKGEQA